MIAPVGGNSIPQGPDTPPKNLADAAKQFEALLIAQLLKSARESGSGDWTGEKGGPMSSMQAMAEQNLAQTLSSQGGLGLATLILSQLGPDAKPKPPEPHLPNSSINRS
jgi:Rod binding domain-containing protein